MRSWFKSKTDKAVIQLQVIERRKVFLAFNSYACLRANNILPTVNDFYKVTNSIFMIPGC